MADGVEHLIDELQAQGIYSPCVLEAIKQVPREYFVEAQDASYAYENRPLPIGHQQTISQPYIVARMTSLLLRQHQKLANVLEIGTGSGYQAAILAQLAEEVYSVERIETLYHTACSRFESLGLEHIHVKLGDGALGWPEYAPYDGIIVTAGCLQVAPQWLSQLKVGGCLVLPLALEGQQYLYRITRQKDSFQEEMFEPVVFVPLLPGVE